MFVAYSRVATDSQSASWCPTSNFDVHTHISSLKFLSIHRNSVSIAEISWRRSWFINWLYCTILAIFDAYPFLSERMRWLLCFSRQHGCIKAMHLYRQDGLLIDWRCWIYVLTHGHHTQNWFLYKSQPNTSAGWQSKHVSLKPTALVRPLTKSEPDLASSTN